MPVSGNSAVLHFSAVWEHRDWSRLIVGLVSVAIGVAAVVWPVATLQVIGFLFGLNLVVTGVIRAVLLPFAPGYPLLYRVLGITFGVITTFVGVLCLRNLTGSLALLVLVIAIGWLLDGATQIILSIPAETGKGLRIASGLVMILGAIAVLAWPRIGLATFILAGASVLVIVGIGQIISAIAGMRTVRA